MAFTERYVKVASDAWVNATVYALDAQIVGSDSKNYYCILAHTSETGVKGQPTDGTDWATYWAVSDGTTEVRAWTFAEMIAAAPAAGTRINMKTGAYSIGATTLPTGTAAAPIVIRGYNAAIGDLDDQGRGTDGTLTTTNMPDITITSLWTPGAYCFMQNSDIAGDISSYLIGSTSIDNWGVINCNIINTKNNAAAGAIQGDDYIYAINSDFSCTGAAHAIVFDCDINAIIVGCRILCTLDSSTALSYNYGNVINCVFIGSGGTSIAIKLNTGTTTCSVIGNTAYNFGTFFQSPNSAITLLHVICNNHVTDCGKYIDNLYSATSDVAVIEMYNRLRDDTTPRTGVLSICDGGEVTTDAGDYTSDYVSATNLRLIYGAAGVAVGMMPNSDIGAYQRARPTLPAVGDVKTGVQYGDAGTQYTGTYAGGGGVSRRLAKEYGVG